MGRDAKAILVYADWPGLGSARPVGTLHVDYLRNRENFSFEYDEAWLRSQTASSLDPDLQFFRGRQYPRPEATSFGIFLDSSPDRWGRMLMRRREAIRARREDRPAQVLGEADYLLGVHDLSRMGALRFKTEGDGPFMAEDEGLATPPWARLRELEEAARNVEGEEEKNQEEKWLDLLLAPGSSLGGSRPKANVVDEAGGLWIAKFPARGDTDDSGAWEKLVHDLAREAGLDVPESRLERFSSQGSTFLVKRFDRGEAGSRIHYASAMTLLGKKDGSSAKDGSSYLELVEFIRKNGAQPRRDLEELWMRVAFSIAVSNTDDHLRNHGFLLESSGWRLSPLFDVNPNPDGRGLCLNISEDDNSLDFSLALSQAPFFMLEEERAKELLGRIREAVSGWESRASKYGIPASSARARRGAFRLPPAWR